jgi:transposase-like protein
MPKSPSNEALADATEMYLAGSSIAAAAREVGVPVHRLTAHLERLGVKRHLTPRDRAKHLSGGHPRRTDVTQEDVITLYRSGWSVLQLAQRFHCNRSVIEGRLRKAGVRRHTRREAAKHGPERAKAQRTNP